MTIDCPVSLGELVDKLTILEIKSEKIGDEVKLVHVKKEYQLLESKLTELKLGPELIKLRADLKDINLKLWVIEDDIRMKEKNQEFDEVFIELARAVYVTNDQRFAVKNLINQTFDSGIVEVKSYEKYR
jgi:predicted nuclease with TOPRIM domain